MPNDGNDSASMAVKFVAGRQLDASTPDAITSGINDAAQRHQDTKLSIPAIGSNIENR
jgi:hypothetical protein